MPKIHQHTPAWLSKPWTGFQLFNPHNTHRPHRKQVPNTAQSKTVQQETSGANRTIAHRGAEVFAVVENELRWADLSLLKERWEQVQATPSKGARAPQTGEEYGIDNNGPQDGSYRILQTGIHEQIRQLVISPNGRLMAIATSHTVHLAILPDSSHLGQLPNTPIKLKVSTIGRTIHIVSQSPLASVLWHPLGVSGKCLVTVTVDGAVRLWELEEASLRRWSSDAPTVAIDLRKLALGTNSKESFAPDRGKNRRFTTDAVGMDVASATFGGTGLDDEDPWASMTLWIAMKAGDLYALCPLLPFKWQPNPATVPAVSTSVVEQVSGLDDDDSASSRSLQLRDQYHWVQSLDGQTPSRVALDAGNGQYAEVYKRPEDLPEIPKLQGPYQILADNDDDDIELCDILVVAAKANPDDAFSDDDSDSELDEDGLSATILVLTASNGRCYVCLDLEGVEGAWLPLKESDQTDASIDPFLVVLEALDTLQPASTNGPEWPSFSQDVESRYTFFITHSQGVFHFSLAPWITALETEIRNGDSTGSPVRLNVLGERSGTTRQPIFTFENRSRDSTVFNVPACIALEDSDLGYFLMTTHDHQPQSVTLERPYSALVPALADPEEDVDFPEMEKLKISESWAPYQPSAAFYGASTLPSFLEDAVPTRNRPLNRQQVRLSPATLDVMLKAHRKLSRDTSTQAAAAADLFRRCETMLEQLEAQVTKAQGLLDKTAPFRENGEDYEGESGSQGLSVRERLDERRQRAQDRQQELQQRLEVLKERAPRALNRDKPLSDAEKAWVKEVSGTAKALDIKEGEERSKAKDKNGTDSEGPNGDIANGNNDDGEGKTEDTDEAKKNTTAVLRQRLDSIATLKQDLLNQVQEFLDSPLAIESGEGQDPDNDKRQNTDRGDDIPAEARSRKLAQVTDLLSKEYVSIHLPFPWLCSCVVKILEQMWCRRSPRLTVTKGRTSYA